MAAAGTMAGAPTSVFGGAQSSSIGNELAAQFASNVFENTKTRARGVIDLYANIDIIRPYFDVYPSHVVQRLVGSLLPRKTSPLVHEPLLGEVDSTQPAAGTSADLYGPVMLCFTLASLLQLGLKLANVGDLKEGTLVGTSLFVVFMYWTFSSMLYTFLAFMFSSSLTVLQAFSVSGYSLFGPCVSMLIHCFVGNRVIDTTALMMLGALSALSMAMLFFFKTPQRKHGAAFAVIVVLLHFGFVLWMNLMYTAYPIHSRSPSHATPMPVEMPAAMPVQEAIAMAMQGPTSIQPQNRKH